MPEPGHRQSRAAQLEVPVRPLLVLAGVSVRAMAEQAKADGFDVLALDRFGDADTRAASRQWWPLPLTPGPGAACIDPTRWHQTLQHAAALGACGWVAGSGFEAQSELLDTAPAGLPLLGTAAAGLRRLRDPVTFFGALAAHGIPHPPVVHTWPASSTGWLLKDLHSNGGAHVHTPGVAELGVPGQALPPHQVLQRQWPGVPMSATFVANGQSAVVLGVNRQLTCRQGDRPHVFAGVIGPVPLAPAAAAQVQRALACLVPTFGVVGLGSLDLLVDGAAVVVLELNARPSASTALYADRAPLAAHVAACLSGRLPAQAAGLACSFGGGAAAGGHSVHWPAGACPDAVHGMALVYATQSRRCGAPLASALAALDCAHDLPHADDLMAADAPLCSLSAHGADDAAVAAVLAQRHAHVLHLLETLAP